LTYECLLDFPGAHSGRRQSEKRKARIGYLTVSVNIDNGDNAGNGKVTVAPRDLFHCVARRRLQDRKNDCPKNLIGAKSCRQVIDEKLVGPGNMSHPISHDLELCIEGERDGGKLGRGIGMNKASTYGAAVADGQMTDMPDRLGE
jgi:hypothetical protein